MIEPIATNLSGSKKYVRRSISFFILILFQVQIVTASFSGDGARDTMQNRRMAPFYFFLWPKPI
ncbi:hypothetical protein TREPR_0994 [Treponema primitia ZAS-2]|uniref:Uncharacterized protein n=1 Tax=Treponema primitia (strain ATCC BAA-887 / DSM 12427 / ZAS-2) TaxID=545694 RepID=F5YHS7_TREPZ|nr:hypothetical protein TREPR_0994 [Treponema primitia ZAS-2]